MVPISLDLRSGVPVYRQIIDQIMVSVAAGTLAAGDQLPTVRQLAVDLAINPNTVIRAYREMEIRGVLETHQGSGTFVADRPVPANDAERQRRMNQLIGEFVARMGAEGFTTTQLIERMAELYGYRLDQKGGNQNVGSDRCGESVESGIQG